MTTLFELAAEYRAISDKLHDTEMDDQTIADTLEGFGGDLQDKAVNVAKFFRNIEADADKIEEAANQMLARAKMLRGRSASLKQYLHTSMEHSGISKIECPWFVISIKQNPEAVTVDDETSVPRDYFKEIPATFKLDKTLVKQAIKDGHNVPGCHLSRGTRLEIK